MQEVQNEACVIHSQAVEACSSLASTPNRSRDSLENEYHRKALANRRMYHILKRETEEIRSKALALEFQIMVATAEVESLEERRDQQLAEAARNEEKIKEHLEAFRMAQTVLRERFNVEVPLEDQDIRMTPVNVSSKYELDGMPNQPLAVLRRSQGGGGCSVGPRNQSEEAIEINQDEEGEACASGTSQYTSRDLLGNELLEKDFHDIATNSRMMYNALKGEAEQLRIKAEGFESTIDCTEDEEGLKQRRGQLLAEAARIKGEIKEYLDEFRWARNVLSKRFNVEVPLEDQEIRKIFAKQGVFYELDDMSAQPETSRRELVEDYEPLSSSSIEILRRYNELIK